ncbi:MAG: hypothetical protein F6K24_39875 [Okeania sp. SIO2D1]|nr:hypothetical protein [Okeania sp. SIO2D1]
MRPMGQDEWLRWFTNWKELHSPAIAQAYFSFLKQQGLFSKTPKSKEIANLVRQPWMLYILGILYRDGLLEEELLTMKPSQARYAVYDRICRWLLGESSPGTAVQMPEIVKEGLAHAYRTPEVVAKLLVGRKPRQIRHHLEKLAFKMLQTGGEALQLLPAQTYEKQSSDFEVFPPLPALFFRVQPYQAQTPIPQIPLAGELDLGILEVPTQTENYTYQTQNIVPELSLIIAIPKNSTLRYFLGITYIENDGTLYQRVCKASQQDFIFDILPKIADFKLDKSEINELDNKYCSGK